jgi:hypothetical protein
MRASKLFITAFILGTLSDSIDAPAQEPLNCKGEAAYFNDGDVGVHAWIVRSGTKSAAYGGPATNLPGIVFEVVLPGGAEGSLHGPARSSMFIGPEPVDLRDVQWNVGTELPWDNFFIKDDSGTQVYARMQFVRCEAPPPAGNP